eukprot:3026243-Pyramimonas_sp.AAC.1
MKTVGMTNFGGVVEFVRELCELADPAEEDQRFHSLEGRLAFLRSFYEALHAYGVLARMGGAYQQSTNDGGSNFYNHLAKAMSTINARVNASTNMDVDENGVIPQMDLEANMHYAIQKIGQ